jgi:hypothetical protein
MESTTSAELLSLREVGRELGIDKGYLSRRVRAEKDASGVPVHEYATVDDGRVKGFDPQILEDWGTADRENFGVEGSASVRTIGDVMDDAPDESEDVDEDDDRENAATDDDDRENVASETEAAREDGARENADAQPVTVDGVDESPARPSSGAKLAQSAGALGASVLVAALLRGPDDGAGLGLVPPAQGGAPPTVDLPTGQGTPQGTNEWISFLIQQGPEFISAFRDDGAQTRPGQPSPPPEAVEQAATRVQLPQQGQSGGVLSGASGIAIAGVGALGIGAALFLATREDE